MEQRRSGHRNSGGFVTLLSTLVAGAAGLAVALAVLFWSAEFSSSSFTLQRSFQAKALADACAEEALEQLNLSPKFLGGGALTMGQGTCTYSVGKLGGPNRSVFAVGTVSNLVRKVSVTAQNSKNGVTVSSWQEVPD